jgi:hypothetical protein
VRAGMAARFRAPAESAPRPPPTTPPSWTRAREENPVVEQAPRCTSRLLAYWDLWLRQAQATNDIDEALYSYGVFDRDPAAPPPA